MSRALMLGEVIERLERLSPDLRCTPAFGEPDSWRGDYACIAFGPRDSATVREMLSCAKAADDATFTGYKGGHYRMTRKTECYVAAYGKYGGQEEDALSTDNFPWLVVPGSVEQLRAALAAAEAKLADERRHSDEMAESIAQGVSLCEQDVPPIVTLGDALKAHRARRAAEVK